jgi:hypothetical protein
MPDVESRRVLLRAWLALPMLGAPIPTRAAPALRFEVELRWVGIGAPSMGRASQARSRTRRDSTSGMAHPSNMAGRSANLAPGSRRPSREKRGPRTAPSAAVSGGQPQQA